MIGVQAANYPFRVHKADHNEAKGLYNKFYIAKNAKIILTQNLDPKLGLYNGAVGEIKEIFFYNKGNIGTSYSSSSNKNAQE